MLTQIKQHVENPTDVPDVPRYVNEYLQVKYNAGYALQSGLIDNLKARGWSESYIAGFLGGLNYASQVLDDIESIHKMRLEGVEEEEEVLY